ncbi:methyl-accepting chemotaxis sensory transducer [Roseibium sp. TrichSKD4]|uniref:hypothetical protein n=1 Tax=Roseibium sp. TrichSKD4 TaxID=744980 RepID=UPI0001E5694B|nr:hypothetical protein [Roseibium sp. TrichSKD4]EFO31816.1 methyl-accepting chemotaxis sensory transducer [Roseibium sp. TrichSKD4]
MTKVPSSEGLARTKPQKTESARALIISICLGLGLAATIMIAAVLAPANAVQPSLAPEIASEDPKGAS